MIIEWLILYVIMLPMIVDDNNGRKGWWSVQNKNYV